MDIDILPAEDPETLWADPHAVEGKILAISQVANTFDDLARHGPEAYPQGLDDFRRRWQRTTEDDLPRLERMAREGELARMDRRIEASLDPSLRHGGETLPACYAALKAKLARLLPLMREHGFAEPPGGLLETERGDGGASP